MRVVGLFAPPALLLTPLSGTLNGDALAFRTDLPKFIGCAADRFPAMQRAL
jgi:hypothetical protein